MEMLILVVEFYISMRFQIIPTLQNQLLHRDAVEEGPSEKWISKMKIEPPILK